MTHLRIFISSPGDVGREREIADQMLTWLQTKSSRLTSVNHAHDDADSPRKSNSFDFLNLK